MTTVLQNSITLPTDTGNAGKPLRTLTRVSGGVTQHEHYQVPDHALDLAGKYWFASAQQTIVQTAHNGTSTGFFWLQMPAAATTTALIRRIVVDANAGSALATPTAPVISFTKFTFTGTASGASVTVLPSTTATVTNQAIMRSAATGMTITLVNPVAEFSVPSAETGVGVFYAQKELIRPEPTAFVRGFDLELAGGEGLAMWESVGGTASDTRNFVIHLEWLEVNN